MGDVSSWHARYAQARVLLLDGSDHAISDFEIYVPLLLEHLQLATSPTD